jgi:peptide deformylase
MRKRARLATAGCCTEVCIDQAIEQKNDNRPLTLRIMQAGELVLRQQARALSLEEIHSQMVRELIDNMRETMRDAAGVGLAAPQVGVPLQLAVIEDRPEYQRKATPEQLAERERGPVSFHVIINPKLTLLEGATLEFFEGCLSVDGYTAIVPRAQRVRVECLDENAKPRTIEVSGWHARILQHEIDHLHGTLYVDRMYSRSLMKMENLRQGWKGKSMAEIREALRT